MHKDRVYRQRTCVVCTAVLPLWPDGSLRAYTLRDGLACAKCFADDSGLTARRRAFLEDANRKAAERRAAVEAALSCAGTADDMILSLCPSHTAAAGVSHVKLRFAYYERSDRRVPFDFSYNRYPDCDDVDGCRADAELLYHCTACYRRSFRCGSEACTSTPGNQDCPWCQAYSLPSLLGTLRYLGEDEEDCTSCFFSVDILWHGSWRFWPDRWFAMGLTS